jgi:hypothetical protein
LERDVAGFKSSALADVSNFSAANRRVPRAAIHPARQATEAKTALLKALRRVIALSDLFIAFPASQMITSAGLSESLTARRCFIFDLSFYEIKGMFRDTFGLVERMMSPFQQTVNKNSDKLPG